MIGGKGGILRVEGGAKAAAAIDPHLITMLCERVPVAMRCSAVAVERKMWGGSPDKALWR